jgi:hypothetical protein
MIGLAFIDELTLINESEVHWMRSPTCEFVDFSARRECFHTAQVPFVI